MCSAFFFFNDTATTEIYTLSLHDALPICLPVKRSLRRRPARGEPDRQVGHVPHRPIEVLGGQRIDVEVGRGVHEVDGVRSEEHTSELQSRLHLVCRLLLEKKKKVRAEVVVKDVWCSLHVR